MNFVTLSIPAKLTLDSTLVFTQQISTRPEDLTFNLDSIQDGTQRTIPTVHLKAGGQKRVPDNDVTIIEEQP